METEILDQKLREAYPANVEGSKEFNECAAEDINTVMQETKEAIEAKEEESLRDQIMQVVNNPVIRENALINAQDIKSKFSGWFRVVDLQKRMQVKEGDSVKDLLDLLCLFEFAFRKMHKGEIRYKIQFSNEDKLSILQEELKEAERKVSEIKRKIEVISNN